MNKNKSLDNISIVMIAVFFVLVLGGGISMLVFANKNRDAAEQGMPETSVEQDAGAADTVKYETYEELFNKLVEVCQTGDVEGLYGLYYNDLLNTHCEKSGVSKEEYDSFVKSYMVKLGGFEEHPFGGDVLLDVQQPIGYVNELHYRAYGEPFPYSDANVQDCVAVRGYLSNGESMDFMIVKIDDLWYMAV